MAKRVAIKGDDYELNGDEFTDSINDPEKKNPPEPPDPTDPTWYPSTPYWDLASIKKKVSPDTGEEFVFCNKKPVVFVGYTFSILTRTKWKREWELEEDGHMKGPYKDKKEGTSELGVKAVEGSDYVFIDGIPVSFIEGGVSASGTSYVYNKGKPTPAGQLEGEGEFTECFGHVYVD